jgi:hypothetical protein
VAKRRSSVSLLNFSIPSTFSAALAGAELASRPRTFISIVLDTVIAAVPTSPATNPEPMPCVSFLIIGPPPLVLAMPRALGA